MINTLQIYRRAIELLNEQVSLAEYEQGELEKYKRSDKVNEKYVERRQFALDKRIEASSDMETLLTALYDQVEKRYKEGFKDGRKKKKKEIRMDLQGKDPLTAFDKEKLRAQSITDVMEKFPELF